MSKLLLVENIFTLFDARPIDFNPEEKTYEKH